MEKEREIDWEAEYIGWQKSGLLSSPLSSP